MLNNFECEINKPVFSTCKNVNHFISCKQEIMEVMNSDVLEEQAPGYEILY